MDESYGQAPHGSYIKLDYLRICSACDAILKRSKRTLATVAIEWLHVLNEHPSNLMRYHGKKSSILLNLIVFFGKTLLQRLPGSICNLRSPLWFSSKPIAGNIDVIFISHLLNKSQAIQSCDFYFGDLDCYGSSRFGLNIATLQRIHFDFSASEAVIASGNQSALRMYISEYSRPRYEIYFTFIQLSLFFELLIEYFRMPSCNLDKAVVRAAASQALTSSTTDNLRFYYSLVLIFQQLKPKSIVLTYEGHAWERIAFAAARHSGVSLSCIGYQHAILFPKQHAALRSLGSPFDPDGIYFSGDVNRRKFANRTDIKAKFDTIGTCRSNLVRDSLPKTIDGSIKACLILPDGTLSECTLLMAFALDAAKSFPMIKFVVRLHPIVDYSTLIASNSEFLAPPSNFELSTLSIEEDLLRCQWALYRGSGAGVRAAAAGLRPIYFKPASELLLIDPMIDLQVWRRVVADVAGLSEIIYQDQSDTWAQRNSEYVEARDYLTNYYLPLKYHDFFTHLNVFA